MSYQTAALIAGSLLLWVALVHVVMAAGSRSGELVWSGRQPRRLDPSLRARSLILAVLLAGSAWTLAAVTGLVEAVAIPDRYTRSATFVVAAFLAVLTVHGLGWGSRWERFFFAPITFLGAALAGYLLLN